ncbi:MAG: hypothetical protein ACLVAK_07595 [Clostridia bacterium]
MIKKFFVYSFYIIILFLLILFLFQSISYGADPKLITTIKKAFEKIETWIIAISTPAAAVAVGTGIFMKKFSFGDEERIRIGKKLIRGSLFSYAFILAIDLILSTIKTLIG